MGGQRKVDGKIWIRLNMKRTSNVIKVIFINLLVFLCLLVVVDMFMGKPSYLTKRSIVLRELEVNLDKELILYDNPFAQNLEQKVFRIRTNADGFIIGENNLKLKPDSVDIIFFGGSTTECGAVEEAKRFPYLVQEILSDSLKREITTLNGGVSGNNSLHSTLNFLAKGVSQNPRVVVLMHNVNDLSGLEKTGSYYKQPLSRMPIEEHNYRNSPIKARLKQLKNALIPNVYDAVKKGIASYAYIDEWESFRNNDTIPYAQIESEFEKSICSFIRVAKSHKIDVILMTQFNRIDDIESSYTKTMVSNYELFIVRYHKLNQKIREIALKEGVALIDLANRVPSEKRYIYDEVHLNTKGSEFVANIIAKYIYENNFLN